MNAVPKPAPSGAFTTETLVNLGKAGEVYVTVSYDYTPPIPGRMYLSNGDPGYPEEPAELDIVSVTGPDGEDLTNLLAEHLQEDDGFFSDICEERDQAWREDREDFECERHDAREYAAEDFEARR